jgi:hypothetical protein
MDVLLIVSAFLVGGACGRVLGYIKAHAIVEPVLDDLRRQVREALATVDELERQEQPNVEARLLERMYRE